MEVVKISPKYQIVIPVSIREALGLRPGEKVQMVQYGSRIELVPLRSIKSLRGFVRGINTSVERDEDRV